MYSIIENQPLADAVKSAIMNMFPTAVIASMGEVKFNGTPRDYVVQFKVGSKPYVWQVNTLTWKAIDLLAHEAMCSGPQNS